MSKVRLAFQDASGLFEDLNISNLETIDCSEVTDAESMFRRATVSNSLDLVSTKKVRRFSNMFSSAKNVQWLMGLDTRAATQMDGMFYGVETFRQRKLVLPDLDLSNCRSMRQAFAFSPVEKLSFVNPSPELSDMYRVIQGCYMLK